MTLYRYVGSEKLTYPYAEIGGNRRPLEVTPGMDPVEFDRPPEDGRWEKHKPAPRKRTAPRKTATAVKKAAPAVKTAKE